MKYLWSKTAGWISLRSRPKKRPKSESFSERKNSAGLRWMINRTKEKIESRTENQCNIHDSQLHKLIATSRYPNAHMNHYWRVARSFSRDANTQFLPEDINSDPLIVKTNTDGKDNDTYHSLPIWDHAVNLLAESYQSSSGYSNGLWQS